ncbi:hypothetical protein QQF64_029871 [Cirrhinus molitorella]|uniref:THAP-type domain-containing protein n=1 Tax=Cirrhinus molitorella TaxID=172907 RepID=A0ABR3N1P8_9TELE
MSYCCVPGCTSYQRKQCDQELSFHRFPTDQKVCREWIVKIRRDVGPYFQVTDNTRVCSKHFTPDCIVRSLTGLHRLKQGSVPTLFKWSCELKTRRTLERHQSVNDIETFEEDEEEGHSFSDQNTGEPSNSGFGALQDHDYLATSPSTEEQLNAAQKEIARLTKENENLRSEKFCLQRFQSQSLVRWTQMQRLNKTEQAATAGFHAQDICLFDQFFLFLCRMRQGLLSADLAVRFNVSKATVSRICITWANYLYFMLGTLPVWPSREAVDELMPPCFKKTFPKTCVVLDCTEIHIQTASSKVLNTVTYSHYKGTTTLKSLIGITPFGTVSFVSNLYTGCISDKEITKESGILKLLEPGDEVMADKGFLIRDLLADINVSLATPAFTGPSSVKMKFHTPKRLPA